jgi:carbonic anhydrase/acetyltransferase-like protein (isoleucine patch superfamily)
MNSVIMDNVVIGEECIIGALCFVPTEMEIPRRKVVVGNPAKIVKDVTDEMIAWKSEGTRLYQRLPGLLHKTLKACEPLREIPANRPQQTISYKTWRQTKSDHDGE